MPISRRLFLGASVGILTAGAALPAAASPVINDTPLLPMQQGEKGHIFTAKWAQRQEPVLSPFEIARTYSGNERINYGNRLNLKVHTMLPRAADEVRSTYEAEDRIFAEAKQQYDERASRKAPLSDHDALNFVVISHSNRIGQRCRRGIGNMAFMHPALVERLTLLERQAEQQIGRWRRVGTLAGSINIFVANHMQHNEFVCAYHKNPMDGAGVLLRQGDRLFLLTPSAEQQFEDGFQSLHRVENYVTRVRI